jgi:(2Fe-2S) ferredoxin
MARARKAGRDADNNMPDLDKLAAIAGELKIGHYSRHIFLCTGEACCSKEVGAAAWEMLKNELKRLNLSLAEGPQACYRTKVGCLRVCKDGPIAVVYPEGTYYAGLTAEKIPEFIEQHLIQNRPMEELIFARNPLGQVDESA